SPPAAGRSWHDAPASSTRVRSRHDAGCGAAGVLRARIGAATAGTARAGGLVAAAPDAGGRPAVRAAGAAVATGSPGGGPGRTDRPVRARGGARPGDLRRTGGRQAG